MPQELFVQDCDLPPIRVHRSRGFGMNRRDRALDLIGAGPPYAKRPLDDPNALLDLVAFPFSPILMLEQHEIPITVDTRLTS
jgi:hypothetical protein